ncbi:MAG: LPXTG-motif cell wall-anchored protein [Alpinimonas sp.]
MWFRLDGGHYIIQSSTSQSGGAWSTPVDVSVAGQNAFSPQVSIDSTGRAIAVWYRYDGSNDIIQSSTSQSGGAWSIPVVVSAAGQDAYDPQVSIDAAGLAVIVWNRYDGSKDRIQSSTIDNPIASTPISASAPELAKTGTNRHDSGVLAMGTAALLILGVGGTLLTRRTKNLK